MDELIQLSVDLARSSRAASVSLQMRWCIYVNICWSESLLLNAVSLVVCSCVQCLIVSFHHPPPTLQASPPTSPSPVKPGICRGEG